MTKSEVYPNAPLALVAAEIRFPPVSDRPLSMPVHKQVRDRMGADWVIHNTTTQLFEAGVGPAGPQASVRSEPTTQIVSRKSTRQVTVRPDAFVLEVTDYVGFDDFHDLVERVAKACESTLQPDGITRVGLRYIDEVSVPASPPEWSRWLHPSLQAPTLGLDALEAARWTGVAQYEVASERILVFRYGPIMGPAVNPIGPLKRTSVAAGELFLLDFDSSWQPTEVPPYDSSRIANVCVELREPIRALFDDVVLPDLVEIFRRDVR